MCLALWLLLFWKNKMISHWFSLLTFFVENMRITWSLKQSKNHRHLHYRWMVSIQLLCICSEWNNSQINYMPFALTLSSFFLSSSNARCCWPFDYMRIYLKHTVIICCFFLSLVGEVNIAFWMKLKQFWRCYN